MIRYLKLKRLMKRGKKNGYNKAIVFHQAGYVSETYSEEYILEYIQEAADKGNWVEFSAYGGFLTTYLAFPMNISMRKTKEFSSALKLITGREHLYEVFYL